jgi:hypothetical protein
MWANADDQGRLCGDPEEIKYAVCPNIDHITKADIPQLLKELVDNKLILCYSTPKSDAIQILDWWDTHQKMQWAWPSYYSPPESWQDHLRYKKDARTVETLNWPVSGEHSGEYILDTQVSKEEASGEQLSKGFPILPNENENERGKRIGRGRGRGNSPEDSGENSSPSLAGPDLSGYLFQVFPLAFGHPPTSRETAQLQDLSKEISDAGGAGQQQIFDAFKEACDHAKFSVSYVRAVLFDWLGSAKK